MEPFLADAYASGEARGALLRAGVSLLEYRRARNLDPAFDAACLELDDIIRISTIQAVELEASGGNLQAVKLLAKGLGELCRPRETAPPSPAALDDLLTRSAADAEFFRWSLMRTAGGEPGIEGFSLFKAAQILEAWRYAEDREAKGEVGPDDVLTAPYFADHHAYQSADEHYHASAAPEPEPCPKCRRHDAASLPRPPSCPDCHPPR